MGVNKVILLGNLGNDPVLREFEHGGAMCTFSLATDHSYFDAEQNRQTVTEWHNIVCFGPAAENCKKYLSKGRKLYLEGRLQTQKWQDKEGGHHVSNRIVANRLQFLDKKLADEMPVCDNESCGIEEKDFGRYGTEKNCNGRDAVFPPSLVDEPS